MKTYEEIKKALECCSDADGFDGDCVRCPYKGELWCGDKIKIDALAYIQQLENHIGELTEMVAQLEAAQPKWISVEERLPDAGEKVMICGVKNGMQIGAFMGLSHPGENRKWWWKKNTVIEVTHWMPLPSMPEPQKEDA